MPFALGVAATGLLAPLSPARASQEDLGALTAYVQARAAGSFGDASAAARGFATALAASPDNAELAATTFVQALEAGDRVLALSAARSLERAGRGNTDVQLLFLIEALRKRDWKGARFRIGEIEKDEVFGFISPILRAWTAQGSGERDPVRYLEPAVSNPLAASYAQEHRPFLLLAAGQRTQGTAELASLARGEGMRDQRLLIAGAAFLARRGEGELAGRLLNGEGEAVALSREALGKGKRLSGEIGSAPAGIAELLVRIAGDLHRQKASLLALRFARLATFAAPENSEAWLVTSDILSAIERHEAALTALEAIASDDPFQYLAATSRIRLLTAIGKPETALAEAQSAVASGGGSPDWARLGDLYSELDRPEEAADAYGAAIKLAKAGDDGIWVLHLLRGSALDKAKKWPEAKSALEASYKLAPEQAIVLNYLGYAQLERRENVQEAMALIIKASQLQPDSAEITDSLGWAHYLQGDIPKAIELLERAAKGQPADPEINEHLGDAYYRAGRRFEARYAWKAAMIYAETDDMERLTGKIDAGLPASPAAP